MKIGVIDLFCGIGGLTCGLQKAGLKVVAGIDVDRTCRYGFEHNNQSNFLCKDVEEIESPAMGDLLAGYDMRILAGCAPCQPFSSHQKDKNNRSRHKNWTLLYQFGRFINDLGPQIVAMENVPELIKEQVFNDFIQMLKDDGYFFSYSVVLSASYGVPQMRRRLVLLASKYQGITLMDKTHKTYRTVRDTIYGLPEVAAGEKNTADRLHVAPALSEMNLRRIRYSVPGGTWRDWPDELKLACHRKTTGRSYPSVYGRMCWDELAPTITTQFMCYGTGRFGHPEQDRALTLREGALIQTFPQGYAFVHEDAPVRFMVAGRHIGNAVPPRLGEVIGLSIKKHLHDIGILGD